MDQNQDKQTSKQEKKTKLYFCKRDILLQEKKKRLAEHVYMDPRIIDLLVRLVHIDVFVG